PPEKITGPRGEQFDVVGPARPIRLSKAPRIPAEAGRDLLVVKEGRIFVCSRFDGDIHQATATGEGLYCDDARYLSEMRLTLGGKKPVLLSSAADLAYQAFFELTNPELTKARDQVVPQMTLNLRRNRLVADRVYERIEIRNHGVVRARTELELVLAADFADMFEIRGVRRRTSRGQALAPKHEDETLRFAYLGQDEIFRETIIEMDPEPKKLEIETESVTARWLIDLQPGESIQVELQFEPSASGERKRRRSFKSAESYVQSGVADWYQSCTRIEGLHRSFDRFVSASARDLRALLTPTQNGPVLTAGIPWYVAPFGRDALLTCYEMMLLNADPARDTLLFLAKHQAKEDDELRDAEPGKILHELRVGELARAGLIPHTPYYGSVDSTPLFLMLAAAYYRWTEDLETMQQLRGSLDAAVGWINKFGDGDGDGFVEYHKRSPAGLDNQGWKDSEDSIVHADGRPAEGPIALAEVQGYVYLGKQRIADVYEDLGAEDLAQNLRSEAAALKDAFNNAFWMSDEGTFALALDGRKRQVKSVTSNAGHCLYCHIADDKKGAGVAERLMAPDMFSGWGIRTLSAESPAYNPMSYHNGSVWPHDNAIVAAGLKRYGFSSATEAIATALFDAAVASREMRLPELFCGFKRREGLPFVGYPVACRPQAWAAAVPFMILQSMLGISARAPEGLLTVNHPALPSWLGHLELHDLRVAKSKISLAFTRDTQATSFALLAKKGPIKVSIQE
ncbi:MAG: glycogen debranching N-terminal domain-containing protein, partial [Actinomycetota bacterium]